MVNPSGSIRDVDDVRGNQQIVPRPAAQIIRTGAAKQDIAASATVEAFISIDRPAGAKGIVVSARQNVIAVATIKIICPVAAIKAVNPKPTIQVVVARAALQQVFAFAACQNVVARVAEKVIEARAAA